MAQKQSDKVKKTTEGKAFSLEMVIAICLAVFLLVLIVIYTLSRGPVVSGSIEYGEGTALPRGSKLSIQLRDTSFQDASSELIAETIIVNPGSPPVAYRLDYDNADIKAGNTYSLQVSIYNPNGQLLFANDTAHDLANPQRSTKIDLALVAVQQQSIPIKTEIVPAVDTTNQQPAILPDGQVPTTTTQIEENTVTVNIYYDEDYDLSAGAKLTVSLQHLGQLAASVNETIAEKEILNPGQPPLAVELSYDDPADVAADSFYLISAGIYRKDGKQLMINSTFGAEMTIKQLQDVDIYLIAIYPDKEKDPADLDASVTGSISYKQSCQLPEGSKLLIQLRDTSYADAPSPLIAEKEIVDPGTSPVKFELKYDSSDIKARNLYSVAGIIYGPSGQLLFINDTTYEVITQGNLSKINLPLIIVKADC